MTRTRTPARMARLVTAWRESGESQAAFARRHRIPTWTFWYWCRKLTTDGPAPATARPTFVPVHVAPDPAAPVIEIVLSGGVQVQVRPGASSELVRAALTALRTAC